MLCRLLIFADRRRLPPFSLSLRHAAPCARRFSVFVFSPLRHYAAATPDLLSPYFAAFAFFRFSLADAIAIAAA